MREEPSWNPQPQDPGVARLYGKLPTPQRGDYGLTGSATSSRLARARKITVSPEKDDIYVYAHTNIGTRDHITQ
eukprot:4746600-Amphidinium_carterae.1